MVFSIAKNLERSKILSSNKRTGNDCLRKVCRTDGGWFLLHKERTDRPDEKATHVFPLEFAISLSHSSLLHPPRSKTIRVEIDIDTGHWNLIHSADEPKLERVFGGKIERSMLRTLFFRRRENFTFERKEGRNRTIPREKFCRPLERIIERACSSPPRTNRRDTILSVRRPMQLVSSNPRETGVPYIYIGSSSVRFPIFNGGRVAFVLPPPSATVHCFLYMEMPRNRIRSRWVSFVWYAFIFYFRF